MSPSFDKTISLFPLFSFFFFFFFFLTIAFDSLLRVAACFFFPSAPTSASPATDLPAEDNDGDLRAALPFTCVTAASGLDLDLD
ncbi:hypothetical protein F5879DRAFT_981369 [Lentinula edodes]|nr:hypothetical protein F5879DRAFT_981369 [Lentinula edodes]